jgi:hypothetical protein
MPDDDECRSALERSDDWRPLPDGQWFSTHRGTSFSTEDAVAMARLALIFDFPVSGSLHTAQVVQALAARLVHLESRAAERGVHL